MLTVFNYLLSSTQTCDEVKLAYQNSECCQSEDDTKKVSFPSTLNTIQERGKLKCGIKTEQYGMSYLNVETGKYSGLDIEYCKGIAAAIGLDIKTDIEWVYTTGLNRFTKLNDKSIDVLIRASTWNYDRDIGLKLSFGAVNFFDGQGFMIRGDKISPKTTFSVSELRSSSTPVKICLTPGTTTYTNVLSYFKRMSIPYEDIRAEGGTNTTQLFINGNCDVISGDTSALVARKAFLLSQAEQSGWSWAKDVWFAKEIISKEPLSAVVRDNDSEWKQVVEWVWYAMITAEEKGWSSNNIHKMTANLPKISALPSNWFQNVIKHVGNYGEVYSRSFCDGLYDGVSGSSSMNECLLPRRGTQNALVSEGGLQFAPPFSYLPDAPEDTNTVNLGYMGWGETAPAQFQSFAAAFDKVIEYAKKDIENQFPDYKLNLVVSPADCGSRVEKATNELLSANVVGVVGMICSSVAKYSNPYFSQKGVPVISPAASSPDLGDSVKYPSFWRLAVNDADQGKALVSFVKHSNVKNMLIVYVANDNYSEGLKTSVLSSVQNEGIQLCSDPVTVSQFLDLTNDAFNTKLQTFVSSGCDGVMFLTNKLDSYITRLGDIKQKMPIYGANGLAGTEILNGYVVPQNPEAGTEFSDCKNDPKCRNGIYLGELYDSLMIMFKAAISSTSEESIGTRIQKIGTNYMGMSGKRTFQDNGDVVSYFNWCRMESGTTVCTKTWDSIQGAKQV